MTIERFEEIKESLDVLKVKKIKAETTMENIQKELKKNYGLDSIEDTEKYIKELEKEKTQLEERLNVLSEKIEKSVDWDEL